MGKISEIFNVRNELPDGNHGDAWIDLPIEGEDEGEDEREDYAKQAMLWKEEQHPRDADGQFSEKPEEKKLSQEEMLAETRRTKFKVRGQGEWEWDGVSPEAEHGEYGPKKWRVKRLSDGEWGFLKGYDEGWAIYLDKDKGKTKPSKWDARHTVPDERLTKGTKNPLAAALDKKKLGKQQTRDYTEGEAAAGSESAAIKFNHAIEKLVAQEFHDDTSIERAEYTVKHAKPIFEKVLASWGTKARTLIGRVNHMKIYTDVEALTIACNGEYKKGYERVHGFYRHGRHPKGWTGPVEPGELHLTVSGVAESKGEDGLDSAEGVFSHEMTHAIDGPAYTYSGDRRWVNAWRKEIGDHKKMKPAKGRVWAGEGSVWDGSTVSAAVLGTKASDLKAGDEIYLKDHAITGKEDPVERKPFDYERHNGYRYHKIKSVEKKPGTRTRHKSVVIEFEDGFQIRPDKLEDGETTKGEIETHYEVPQHANYGLKGAKELPEATLSQYARTKPSEGFAEFGRLLVEDSKVAEEKFPKCYNLWKEWKLV